MKAVVLLISLALVMATVSSSLAAEMKERIGNSKKNIGSALDSQIKLKKTACYDEIDRGMFGSECQVSKMQRENCALRCGAVSCYDAIYGKDPLEEGEIDGQRSRKYQMCAREHVQGVDQPSTI